MTLTNAKLRRLAEIVAQDCNVTVEDILSDTRRKPVAEARHILAYLGDQMFGLGSAEIGRQIGRDHATILHSFEYVLKRNNDTELQSRLEHLRNQYETSANITDAFEVAADYGIEAQKVIATMSAVFARISIVTKELADELDRMKGRL